MLQKIKIKLYRLKCFFKKKVAITFFRIQFGFFEFFNIRFNSVYKQQTKDLKLIPVLIINFNQLNHLKKLIHFLEEQAFINIVIIDNASTYEPLLEYYNSLSKKIKVHLLEQNFGHRVFWEQKHLARLYGKGMYIVTDPDIEPIAACPIDFLNVFYNALISNPKKMKVGFGLDLDSIPDTNQNKSKIMKWEKKFWKNTIKNFGFDAPIDTTFALYRPLNQFYNPFFYEAIRTKPPYVAKHHGWLIDSQKPTEEQIFYAKTANRSFSWKIDDNGQVLQTDYQ